jgi:predicted membrane protein
MKLLGDQISPSISVILVYLVLFSWEKLNGHGFYIVSPSKSKFLFKKLFLSSYFLSSTFHNWILIQMYMFLIFQSLNLKKKRKNHWITKKKSKVIDWHWFLAQKRFILMSTSSVWEAEFDDCCFEPQYCQKN